MTRLTRATTALFVPGDRPERFAKAVASGADIVIIDLEDAVAPEAKAAARVHVASAIGGGEIVAMVRVNAASSAHFGEDLLALAGIAHHPGLLGVMPAKVESTADLAHFADHPRFAGVALVPLIESARGVRDADSIATASGVVRLAFGAIDFAVDVAAAHDDRFLDYARSRLVIASRASGIAAPLDSPATAIADPESVAESARLARGFGFSGKLCIHPAQVPHVRRAFLPTDAEVAWAERVTAAGAGAVQLDGHMVDPPVVARAEHILRLNRGLA